MAGEINPDELENFARDVNEALGDVVDSDLYMGCVVDAIEWVIHHSGCEDYMHNNATHSKLDSNMLEVRKIFYFGESKEKGVIELEWQKQRLAELMIKWGW